MDKCIVDNDDINVELLDDTTIHVLHAMLVTTVQVGEIAVSHLFDTVISVSEGKLYIELRYNKHGKEEAGAGQPEES